jgi:hypothetical protein
MLFHALKLDGEHAGTANQAALSRGCIVDAAEVGDVVGNELLAGSLHDNGDPPRPVDCPGQRPAIALPSLATISRRLIRRISIPLVSAYG